MALQQQPISIDLGLGLDTKSDPKQVVPGKLLTLENAVFRKNKQLRKRDGDKKFPNTAIDGAVLDNGDSLSTFNDELLLYQNQTLYSYSPGSLAWINKGAAVSAIVGTKQIIKNTAQQTQCDSAGNDGLSVYAWEDSRGGVRCSVFDETSGTPILVDTVVDAAGSRARCLSFNRYLYVFYYKSGSLYARRVNPLSATLLETAIVISSTVNTTNPTYDIYGYNDQRILIVSNDQGAAQTKIQWVDTDLAVFSGSLASQLIAEASTNCLGIVPGPSNTFYICYQNGTDGVRCTIRNNGGGQIVAPFDIENITADDVVNITGHVLTPTSVRIYYEIEAAEPYNQLVRYADVSSSGTVGTPADFLRSVGLSSKAFKFTDDVGNAYYYVGLTHESNLQCTYFVARSDGLIVAKQQPTVGGGLTTRPILANVWASQASGAYTWAILNKTQLVSENAVIFTPTGVSSTTLDFSASDVFTAAQLGSNLLIVGGILSMYDGQSIVEHGFHLYPENVVVAGQTTGGDLADGSYQIAFVYEWTDNQGQLHRSAPSVPETVVISGGSGNGAIEAEVPTLRLTAKKSPRSPVSIVGYITESNGTIFYRYTSVQSPILNDTTVDTIVMPDATEVTISNEILYTTGGVLENIAAPACSVIEVFKNRIFLGGLEDQTSYWFSKETQIGETVEFSDQLVRKLEPAGGPIKSFGVLDDKLLMLKRDRYYFIFGDGPNDTGQGGDFSEPQFVTADAGCTSASSMVRTPQGLMFKSAKGIYLIDSTLNPSYVGADVEEFNGNTVTSGVLVPDVNQIRFTTLEGPTLIYDYYQKQWGTFSGVKSHDAVVWQNTYVFLRTSGIVYYDIPNYYKDDESAIRMRIGTGWLSFAGLSGFQRVYKLMVLGEYKSPHRLKVSIAYDFSDAYNQIAYIDPDDLLPITRYGEESPYGKAGTKFGGPNAAYRFVVNLKQQKCQSIKFLIEEEVVSATTGSQESLTITSLGLLVGLKKGMAKFKSSQSVSTGG